MKKVFRCCLALVLAASAAAPAVAQASGPVQPVHTIALDGHSALSGAVTLANHNTVLLLGDTESASIQVQCLAPDGKTAWKNNITRYQRGVGASYALAAFMELDRASRERVAQYQQAMLLPVEVFTNGSTLYCVEHLTKDGLKKQPKDSPLQPGQVCVQRLDEKGQLTRTLFDPGPDPESRKTEAAHLGHYADENGYVEIVRETNKREETILFFADHYDTSRKTVRREPLALPPSPGHTSNMGTFRHWYQEWVFLGHRPNQTYFCRRTLVNTPQDKPGRQPVTFQVYVANDQHAEAGGFSTILGLKQGTSPRYSGTISGSGELNHIPTYYSQSSGRNDYVTLDEWDTSASRLGGFHLDHGSGDVIIYGEYGDGDLPDADLRPELNGYFQRRYSATGQAVGQVQLEYSKAMRADKNNALFKGLRYCRFRLDPLTQQSQYSFAHGRAFGDAEYINLSFDERLSFQRYDFGTSKDMDKRVFTRVLYVEPYWLFNRDTRRDLHQYEQAAKDDLPVYATLEKLRRTAGLKQTDHAFYLSVTGPGTCLVIERPQLVGGSLKVYTF